MQWQAGSLPLNHRGSPLYILRLTVYMSLLLSQFFIPLLSLHLHAVIFSPVQISFLYFIPGGKVCPDVSYM